MKQYPFRFYGREPADWTLAPEGFLYDLQFAKALDAKAREAVRAVAERQFGRGPGALGDVWSWGGDRFLVLSVTPRIPDAARMIFTQVAEFLSVLHQTARIRDVVFCNGYGARADRWDAWTLQQSPEADPGPRRPETPWAKHLRRPVRDDLEYAPSEAPRRREAPSPASTRSAAMKPLAPAPDARADGFTQRDAPAEVNAPAQESAPARGSAADDASSQSPVRRTPLEALPASEAEELVAAGWSQLSAAFSDVELVRIVGPSIPIGWVRVNYRNVAVVCFNAQGVPQRIEIPDGGGSVHLAVDPDGILAVTHIGNAIYTIDVPAGTVRVRMAIHENNGPIAAIAWAADDVWAIRVTSQLMFFDLSERDHIYVGTQQPRGALAGVFRHGTLAALHDGETLRFIGVCDWQFAEVAAMPARGVTTRVLDDALYLLDGARVERVDGLDEVYEAWAAPLRRRAELDRTRRMQPPEEGVRWSITTEAEMPPDREKARRDALVAKLGSSAWVHVHDTGDAVVALPKPKRVVSRAARFKWCPAKGRAKFIKCAAGAGSQGVTCFSMDPAREVVFYVAGSSFTIYRISLADEVEERCDTPGFSTRSGLLYDIIAIDRRNLLSIWNDTLDWHRPSGERWETHARRPLDLPRGNAFDRATRRLAVSQQTRERLVVLRVEEDRLEPIAACTDAVKVMTFREGRLFAQMIDGQWFELLGI
ncbi:MAG: hypothetical protein U0326_16935 [Polyangiales bacterium]